MQTSIINQNLPEQLCKSLLVKSNLFSYLRIISKTKSYLLNMKKRSAADDVAYEDIPYKR